MAMTAVLAEHELFDSCRVLFGADLQVSRAFLEYLQRPGIKSAYRQKALATHPDILASQESKTKQQNADLFRIVQQAYEHLTTYLDARESGFQFQEDAKMRRQAAPARPTSKPAPRSQAQTRSSASPTGTRTHREEANTFYRQDSRTTSARHCHRTWRERSIPSRKLLFGHYLYYAGATNWQTIIKALVWQRTGRPRLGEIGRRFGWLTDQDILTILRKRKLSESFGASAVSLGLLTDKQVRLMVFQQSRLQKKIGDYYLQHKLLSPLQLNELATRFTKHNISYSPPRYAFSSRM